MDEFADLVGVIEEGEDDEDDEEEDGVVVGIVEKFEDEEDEDDEEDEEDDDEDDEFGGDKIMKKIISEYRNRRLHTLSQDDTSDYTRGDYNV